MIENLRKAIEDNAGSVEVMVMTDVGNDWLPSILYNADPTGVVLRTESGRAYMPWGSVRAIRIDD